MVAVGKHIGSQSRHDPKSTCGQNCQIALETGRVARNIGKAGESFAARQKFAQSHCTRPGWIENRFLNPLRQTQMRRVEKIGLCLPNGQFFCISLDLGSLQHLLPHIKTLNLGAVAGEHLGEVTQAAKIIGNALAGLRQ